MGMLFLLGIQYNQSVEFLQCYLYIFQVGKELGLKHLVRNNDREDKFGNQLG